MVTADDGPATGPRSAQGRELDRRIDFETTGRIGSDIGCGDNFLNPVTAAEQQSADLARRVRSREPDDRFDQSA